MTVVSGQAPYEALMPGEAAGPPGALLFTIRFARQAIAASPNQHQAYGHLAAAYNYIGKTQEDRWAQSTARQTATPRQDLRRVQLTTVLEQILKVRPGDRTAHELLTDIYAQLKYFDLALEHRKYAVGLMLGAGPANGESLDAYRTRSESIAKQIQQAEEELNKRNNSFEVASQNRPLLERVRIALGHELGQRALQLMLEADISQFKEDEIRLVLELLLNQGRAEDVQAQMREEFRLFLGMNYDWFKAQAAAALGNYGDAYKALEGAAEHLDTMAAQTAVQLSAGQIVRGDSLEIVKAQRGLVELRRQQADFIALAGIIAIEWGDTKLARESFERALSLGSGQAFSFEGKGIANHYLQFIENASPTPKR